VCRSDGVLRGSSRDKLMLDRSGVYNERGDGDGEFERRGGGSSTSGSPPGRGPGCNTGLAASSYGWE